ncbi:hypothetical protein HD806DRAFT_485161 [Xylariaceae sp. AK1471]|nr:hypothetical protein HD806DRAFT_485161 [Xylariaceae sp. AK1471]
MNSPVAHFMLCDRIHPYLEFTDTQLLDTTQEIGTRVVLEKAASDLLVLKIRHPVPRVLPCTSFCKIAAYLHALAHAVLLYWTFFCDGFCRTFCINRTTYGNNLLITNKDYITKTAESFRLASILRPYY